MTRGGPGRQPGASGLPRLLGCLAPYRVPFAAGAAAAVLAAALDGFTLTLLLPLLRLLFAPGAGLPDAPTLAEHALHRLVGALGDTGERGAALRNVVALVLVAVAAKNAALYASDYLGGVVRERVTRDLRTALQARLHQLGLGFFHRTRGGELVARAVADAEQATGVATGELVAALRHAILAVVYLSILLALSWPLALLTLAIAPVVLLVLRPVIRGVRRSARRALDRRGELTAVLSESIEGARLVKAHGAEDYERRRFAAAAQRYVDAMVRTRTVGALASPLSETLGAAVLLILLAASWATDPRGLRPEVFVTFVVVALRLLRPVKLLAQFPAQAQQALAAADRVFEIADAPAEDVDPPGAAPFPGLRREIALRDVWVAYEPGRWVLRGVSLTIRCGEVVALVGPSGTGKSTLADLLPRFVEPQRGAVLVDGVPLARYARRSLRRAMGIVSQHTVIFNDTVWANIAYGEDAGASRDAVAAAARAANAHDFIQRLPQGYDTVLGERGMRLSGGERQRIAIARALLRDPEIVILDEATSSLDAESERLVRQAIERLLEERTVLVIAHRLSTVARADQIVVLDGGRVVERGRHDELVRAAGVYQRLHEMDAVGGGV
jgi:subfamily B ATP-binding cassette protein MsbA